MPVVWEMWVRSQGQEYPLEKGLATHSSSLAWRIHGQSSLAGYRLWGHKRVGCNLATKQFILIISILSPLLSAIFVNLLCVNFLRFQL